MFLSSSSFVVQDTWLYQHTPGGRYWTESKPQVSPPHRYGHGLANVGFNKPFVVLFGGSNFTEGGGRSSPNEPENGILGDTWLLTANWASFGPPLLEWNLVPVSTAPPARMFHAMAAFDPPEGASQTIRAVMFGGCADHHCAKLLDDTWIFQGAVLGPPETPSLMNEGWNLLKQSGSSPSARRGHAMAYVY